MAELSDINKSGELDEINLNGTRVRERIEAALGDGIKIPSLSAADAENGAVFFNTDTGRLSWKSPAGLLLRFRMQLEN